MLHRLLGVAALVLLTLPWVSPLASGPSAAVVPWLVCAACAAIFLLIRPPPNSSLFACAWLIAALLSASVGFVQYAGAAHHLSGWANTTQAGEAFANLRQRNQFASLTNIGLLALIYLVRARGTVALSAQPALSAPVWAVLAAALLGVGNAASSSRTGLLQLAVVVLGLGLWGLWKAPALRRLVVATVVAYAVASLALPALIGGSLGDSGILARFNEQATPCQSRRVLWGNVLTLIGQKPWLGWGWGELDYAHFVTLYPGPPEARFCDILDNAHNLPLHLAVELGVPFAALVCLALAWLILRQLPWREQHPARQLAWGVLLMIGVHSLLEYPLWYGPFQIAVGLCLWILWKTQSPVAPSLHIEGADLPAGPPTGAVEKKGSFVQASYAFIAIVFISCIAYAMWDYHRISQIYRAPAERSAAYRYNTFEKIRGSWLFQDHVQFAQLTTTPVTAVNAGFVYEQASRLLHFSPEARVVEKLIESATLLGLNDEVDFFKQRYAAAFAQAYGQWQARQTPQ